MEKYTSGEKFNRYESDLEGYVSFPAIATGELRQQAQYASRYVDGVIEDYPNLGEGLRFKGDPSDYHSLRIHKDDVQEFVQRVTLYKKSTSNPFA